MNNTALTLDGLRVPRFFYGTAWKEGATQSLVELAIKQGFRGIDTANQRRHYVEADVGKAIAAAIERDEVTRDELFLQTKFTFQAGQDHRLPYDPNAAVATQVEQSLASSIEHLRIEAIDSYVLHGPSRPQGLGAADREAWEAMEDAVDRGQTRFLGVSNVDANQLEQLCASARIQPTFVQNRCFARTAWDRPVRQLCAANHITYQGFSLLTANHEALFHPEVTKIARRRSRTVQQIIFRFALELAMIPLTGTTDQRHMQQDLEVFAIQLEPKEVRRIESCIAG